MYYGLLTLIVASATTLICIEYRMQPLKLTQRIFLSIFYALPPTIIVGILGEAFYQLRKSGGVNYSLSSK